MSNWYVKFGASGTGTGTSWTNAWATSTAIVWGSVAAGDTIWYAGSASIYATLTIGASGTSGNVIAIKRVRSTDAVPVAAAGWNSSFDSTVTINRVDWFGYSFVTLDGQIPNVGLVIANDNEAAKHGIDFSNQSSSDNTIVNLAIIGVALDQTTPNIGDVRCINLNFNGPDHGAPALHRPLHVARIPNADFHAKHAGHHD